MDGLRSVAERGSRRGIRLDVWPKRQHHYDDHDHYDGARADNYDPGAVHHYRTGDHYLMANVHDYDDDNFYYCPRNDCPCHDYHGAAFNYDVAASAGPGSCSGDDDN